MGRRERQARKEISELLGSRRGWRLEPRTTPGAAPLWCFVDDGEIEYSVTVEDGVVRLYVMQTDQDLVFQSSEELTAWLSEHRADALEGRPVGPDAKTRMQSLFRWN